MTRNKIIYQLFPSYLGVIIIAVLALIWFANNSLNDFYYKEKREGLKARAFLIGYMVSSHKPQTQTGLNKICQELGTATGTRITIISLRGEVLGDSHQSPEKMDNHSNRPEISDAYEGKTGTSIRYSNTLQVEMMYLAIPAKMNGDSVIVRTSLPVTSLKETVATIRGKIIIGSILIAMIAAAINFVISRRIVRPLEDMKEGAQRFAQGDFKQKLVVPKTEEIAALAISLNEMASQLDRRIQTVIRQRNERDAILTSMVEGVLAADKEEKIISINEAAASLIKVNRNKAVGKTVNEIVKNPELSQFIQAVLLADKDMQTEIVLPAPTDHYLKVTGTILKDPDSRQIGVLIVLNDITEIRRLENIRRDFVANVSHELKTPITSIKGYVETLREADLEETQKERFLGIVGRQANRLNAIVDDLLELARIEQQKEKEAFTLKRMPVKPILESAIQDCSENARKKGIKIELDCEQNLKAMLNDRLMQQAIINLIDNAIKYSEESSEVIVTAEKAKEDVVIAVQDFGIGIGRQHFERLFERFYRVDKARSRQLGGTGLGLSIVKHITQGHGGKVSVKSKRGEGSTFTVKLPVISNILGSG